MPNIWDIYRHLKFLPTHVFIFSSVIMQFLYMRRTVPKCVDLRVQAQKSGTLIWNLAETMSGAKAQTWCMAVKCIELRVAVFFSKIRIWRTPPPYRVQGAACRSSMGSGDHMEGRHSGRCSPVDEHCGRFTLPCILYRLTALLFFILFLPHQFSFCHSSRRTSALHNLTSMLCPATNYWTYFALFPKRRN